MPKKQKVQKKEDDQIRINPAMKKPSSSDGDVTETVVSSLARSYLSENLSSSSISRAMRIARERPDVFLDSLKALLAAV